jgi:hypothetical protein
MHLHTTITATTLGLLASALALSGCGDDGGGSDTTGTSSTTSDDTTSSSTTSDDTTSTSSSTSGVDSSSSTGNGALGWGDCRNNPEEVACMPDEFCGDFGTGAVCMLAGCAKSFDCPPPLAREGQAPVVCGDVSPLSEGAECYYLCSGGQTCPLGMECAGDACAWPG